MVGRRLPWVVLATGIAVVTVTVPALILPRPGRQPDPPQVVASTGPDPSPTTSPSASGGVTRTSPPAASATRCGSDGGAVQAGPPSCHAYDAILGYGWQVSGTGAKVLTGQRIPGSTQLALRVEPERQTASVTLIPATPVVTSAHGKLTVNIYGGPVRGTTLRVSAAGSGAADPSRAVVLTAPPDHWTAFTADLTRLLPGGATLLGRIDFTLAYDLNPNLRRFFLDGVLLVE
jgi:hypothetical protein